MRRWIVLVWVLAPAVARADGADGAASATIEGELDSRSDEQQSAVRVGGAVTSDLAWSFEDGDDPTHLIVTAAGTAEARSGDEKPLSASGEGSFYMGNVPLRRDDGEVYLSLWPTRVTASFDVERLPGIDARRDLRRAAYSRRALDVDLDFTRASNGHIVVDFVRLALATARTEQQEDKMLHRRREESIDIEFLKFCLLRRAVAPALCLEALGFDAEMALGGKDATVVAFDLVGVSGVRLPGEVFADAGVGVVWAGPGETNGATLGGEVHTVEDDLPMIDEPLAHLRVARPVGRLRFDATLARAFYLTIDGDLALEDSVRGALSWTAGRSEYFARGFAAHTRWWTSMDDPGSDELTGGGELGVIRRERIVEVEAAAGVARTFYPELDGGAVDRVGLAGTARLVLRRGVEKTW